MAGFALNDMVVLMRPVSYRGLSSDNPDADIASVDVGSVGCVMDTDFGDETIRVDWGQAQIHGPSDETITSFWLDAICITHYDPPPDSRDPQVIETWLSTNP